MVRSVATRQHDHSVACGHDRGAGKRRRPAAETNAPAGESLAAVARRYRREKNEREAQQASRTPAASQFHLEIPAGSLAEVAPGVVLQVAPHAMPHVAPQIVPRRAPPLPTAAPPSTSLKTGARGLALRRDPFSQPAAGLAGKHFRCSEGDCHGARANPICQASPKNVTSSFLAIKAAPVNDASVSSNPKVASETVVSERSRSGLDARASLVTGTVTIRAGDSLWKLSRQYSGSAVRWTEWLRRNPGLGDPRSLRVGAVLLVPPRAEGSPPGSSPALRAVARTVVVRSGDSLWKISAERYGDGARWPCVARANAGLRDAAVIFPGQRLLLPAACGNAVSSLGTITH